MTSQMPLNGSGNTTSAPLSSLNLEPNPFEQSFATTENTATTDNSGNVHPSTTAAGAGAGAAASAVLPPPPPPPPLIPATSLSQISQVLQQPHVLTQKSPYASLQSPPPLLERTSNLSISRLTSGNRDTTTYGANQNPSNTLNYSTNPLSTSNDSSIKKSALLGQNFSSSFMFSSTRPNISSPGALTPGGSKKLQPLILSPNFIPLGGEDGNHPNANAMTNTNLTTNGTSSANANNTTSNGYFSYIPRTGLTPNESSIRSALTPGSMYPLLPSIGLNNNNNNNTIDNSNNNNNNNIDNSNNSSNNNNNTHSTSSSLPNISKGNVTPAFPGNKNTTTTVVNDYMKLTNNKYNMTPSGSVFGTPAPFTPGISSILNMNGNSQPNSGAPGVGELVNTTPMAKIENDLNHHNIINHNEAGNGAAKNTTKHRNNSTSSSKSKKRKSSASSNEGQSLSSQKNSVKPVMNGGNSTNMKQNKSKNMGQEYIDDRERKRREFLERNRLAASKFRKRKKEYIQKIEHDFRSLQTDYDEMRSVMDAMCSFNSCRANASILTKLRFHLQQNDVSKAMVELDQLQSLVEHTDYFKRDGQSVIALQEESGEGAEMESNDSNFNKFTRTIKASTTLPQNPNTNGKPTISIIPEFKETNN